MPAMTMTYRIVPASALISLHAGERIVGSRNAATSPNTLSDVRVVVATAIVSGVSPIRHVALLRVGDKVPQTALVDQSGTPFTFSKFAGEDVVLAFIYTRCTDALECPLTSTKFGELQTQLRSRRAHLVEVTLDPAYDTPPVLARYARQYGADPKRWTMAGGKPNDVLNFAAGFGLDPFYDPTQGLIHGETLATIDANGTIHDLVYTNSWQPSEIIASLDDIDHLAANPIARLDLWLTRAAVAICGNSVGGFDGLTDLVVVILVFSAAFFVLWRLYLTFFPKVKRG